MQLTGPVSNNTATVRLNSTADINTYVLLANRAGGTGRSKINPELFYTKQLLDTIRYDADNYVYYRLADETPIQEKADFIQFRRWSPLRAHTTPLVEGIPPMSDKGSVEEYKISAKQYGRYMEFTDKVDFNVIDPVIAHYSKEYSLVAMETFDLLAKECLLSIANPNYAGSAASFDQLKADGSSKPTLTDLRIITLNMKKHLIKPRSNGRYHVIGSPEFYFDMVNDPTVQAYMTINQSTGTMFSNTKLVPMFDMEFYETMLCPTSGEYMDGDTRKLMIFRWDSTTETYMYKSISDDSASSRTYAEHMAGYVGYFDDHTKSPSTSDGATGSYMPDWLVWKISAYTDGDGNNDYVEFKAQHILVIGKDALVRTGLAGEGQAKMYAKAKGSSGVLDPIDQRQSIGFKINSVGFGCTRLEAVQDYICVPTQVNLL